MGKPSQTCTSGCACLDSVPGSCPAAQGGTCAGTDVVETMRTRKLEGARQRRVMTVLDGGRHVSSI